MAQLDETFGEGAGEKLQALFAEHEVPDEAQAALVNIALTTKPPKKDFFQAVTEVQKAHKIDNVFYLQFADFVSALGKKGTKKVSTEKKARARKAADELAEMERKADELAETAPRYSVTLGPEGIVVAIPWDEVRKHLQRFGGGVGEGVGSKEPEPLVALSEPEKPALTLVEPARLSTVSDVPWDTTPTKAAAEAEAPLPQAKPEMLASLPTPTGNREPMSRAELVSWYISAICGGARYGGEPTLWDKILFNSAGARRRITDIAQRSGATVEQTLKFLRTQYDPSIVNVTVDDEYAKVELGVDIQV